MIMMNKTASYTHAVSFFKKDQRHGWTFTDFKTTEDALKLHLIILANHEAKGTVRAVTFSKI